MYKAIYSVVNCYRLCFRIITLPEDEFLLQAPCGSDPLWNRSLAMKWKFRGEIKVKYNCLLRTTTSYNLTKLTVKISIIFTKRYASIYKIEKCEKGSNVLFIRTIRFRSFSIAGPFWAKDLEAERLTGVHWAHQSNWLRGPSLEVFPDVQIWHVHWSLCTKCPSAILAYTGLVCVSVGFWLITCN